MRHTLNRIFHSGKFVIGFCIFLAVLLITIIYPLIVPDPPLESIGQGTFFPPGIYVNIYDSVNSVNHYSLNMKDSLKKRIEGRLNEEDLNSIKELLILYGVPASEINTPDIHKLLDQWADNYDPKKHVAGLTNAKRNYYERLNDAIDGILSTEGVITAVENPDTGVLSQKSIIKQSDYANLWQVDNVTVLPLGTDNFGRDVLTELIKATAVSLQIGFVAGIIATLIGLVLGLLSGYIGGLIDDGIMFLINLFTVIPSFVLLILISFSIGQEQRGAFTIAVVIGLTSWVWTARAVRSQVLSLRNRDHVNLSKISGHSIFHIIIRDILPYIASYVVMALILQISSGILAEAGLSILGLGPKTTDVPTLGLMMNWAMIYNAHLQGQWWA